MFPCKAEFQSIAFVVARAKRFSDSMAGSSFIGRSLSFRFAYKEICGNEQASYTDDRTRHCAGTIGLRGRRHLQPQPHGSSRWRNPNLAMECKSKSEDDRLTGECG